MSSHPTRTEKCEDNDNDEDDEYTYDDLDGVDLDSIPELCLPPTQHAQLSPPPQPSPQPPQSQQSQATDPQRLASSSLPRVVEHSACPVPTSTVADNPSATAARSPDSTGRSTTPSTDYGLEDEIDDEFLKELDDLENKLLESTNQSRKAAVPSSSAKVLAPTDPAATTSQLISHPPLRQASEETHRDLLTRKHYQKTTENRSSQKRPLSQKGSDSGSAIPTESPEQAARGGEGPSKKLKKLMDDFEDEMSCPICCDLFACAYLFNPCGHSYCGDCALRWMEKNKDAPVCAVCRTHVSKEGAMIANISLDNAVQRHVDALGENGVVEWQRGGAKLVEWTTRKEEWKTSGITRMFDVLKTRPRRRK